MCITSPYAISGDYSSETVANLAIQFERCRGEDKCAEDFEITKWLKRKFIITLRNE